MYSGKKYTILLEEPENGDSNFIKIFIIYFGLRGVTSQEVMIFAPKIIEFTLMFTEIDLSWKCPFFLLNYLKCLTMSVIHRAVYHERSTVDCLRASERRER
jgi:hypothetical protein